MTTLSPTVAPDNDDEEGYVQRTARNAIIVHLECENARLRGDAADHRTQYQQSLRTIRDLVHCIEPERITRHRGEGGGRDSIDLEIASILASMGAGGLTGGTPARDGGYVPTSPCERVSEWQPSVPRLSRATTTTTMTTTSIECYEEHDRFNRWLNGDTDVPRTQATSPLPVAENEYEDGDDDVADSNFDLDTLPVNITGPPLPITTALNSHPPINTGLHPSCQPVPRRRKKRAVTAPGGDNLHGTLSVTGAGFEQNFVDDEPKRPFEAARSSAPSPTTERNLTGRQNQQLFISSSSDTPMPTTTPLPAQITWAGRYSRSRQTVRRFAVGTIPNVHFEFTRKARTVTEIYREWHIGTVHPGTPTTSTVRRGGRGQGNPPIADLERQYGTAWRSYPEDKAAMKYSSNYVSVRRMVVEFVDREVERRAAMEGRDVGPEEVCRALDGVVKGRIQGLTECLRAKRNPFEEFGG